MNFNFTMIRHGKFAYLVFGCSLFKAKGNLKLHAHGGCYYLKLDGGWCHLAVASCISIGEMIRDSILSDKRCGPHTPPNYHTPRSYIWFYFILLLSYFIFAACEFPHVHCCIVIILYYSQFVALNLEEFFLCSTVLARCNRELCCKRMWTWHRLPFFMGTVA